MLKITIQRKHVFPGRRPQSIRNGPAYSVGRRTVYGFDAGISACQLVDDPSGLVAAVVVYRNYLVNVVVVEVDQARYKWTDVHFFIVARNNHGNRPPEDIVDR